MNKTNINLLSLTRKEFRNVLVEKDYKGFRGEQIFNWIYKNGVISPEKMINLPGDLQKKVKEEFSFPKLKINKRLTSTDGTIKYLFETNDGENVESVYLPEYEENRHTICVSSQIGCSVGCKFCATGLTGYSRDLRADEIIAQILQIQKDISSNNFGIPRISNIVFMGMGEPLYLLDTILKVIDILNEPKGFNIARRKFTISTSGIVPGIRRLTSSDKQVGLAVSLNAPDDELRNELMPINKKYPVKNLLVAVEEYTEVTGRRVTFEYILISKINDTINCAKKLGKLLQNINCHINLIAVNPVPECGFERPNRRRINKFKNILSKKLSVTIRKERGSDIDAACGQLRKREGGI